MFFEPLKTSVKLAPALIILPLLPQKGCSHPSGALNVGKKVTYSLLLPSGLMICGSRAKLL